MVTAEGTRLLADWLAEHMTTDVIRVYDPALHVPRPDADVMTAHEWALQFASWFPAGVEAEETGTMYRLIGSIGGWEIWTTVPTGVLSKPREIRPIPNVRMKP